MWEARPSNIFSGHEVAVGLRCGKANKTPRYLARLDPVFARDNSGRSILFSIKEESTRLATSSPLSKRHNGKEPPRVKTLLPLARAPLQKTPTGSTDPAPSFNTLTHVFQATSVPVAQEEDPTLRDGPVVTHGLQPDQLDAIPVNLRKNRVSRQADTAQSPCPFGRS